MSMTSLSVKSRHYADVIMQGWLQKKGEHIKNWRPRYMMLFNDGALLGYVSKPKEDQPFPEPLNDFIIKDAQVILYEKPKNVFMVRCLQWTTIIERTFMAESLEVRQRWASAIEMMANRYRAMMVDEPLQHAQIEDTSNLVDMVSMISIDDLSEQYQAAAHAIMGHNTFETGSPSYTEMMSIADTADAAKKYKIQIEDFEFLKVLGKGTFGKVILCKEKRSNKLYAVKVIKKEVIISMDEIQHTITENRVLQRVKHPFLTQLTYSFQTQHHLCFVMEFANGGELFTHLQKCGTFAESRTKFYAAEITLALGYLHTLSIIYRDMKLENLLLDKDGHIKLADFGLCKEEINFGDTTKTFCGTPEYLAPEVMEWGADYGRSVDWWGLGVVMYEMITGRLPFYSKDPNVMGKLIQTEQPRFNSRFSPEVKDLISKLLIKDPKQRLGGGPEDAMEICKSDFFMDVNWDKLYSKQYEPPFKPVVADATDTSYFAKEFTSAPVVLTPPPQRTLSTVKESDESAFDKFEFYDDIRHELEEIRPMRVS